jgi:hypothetical protein
VECKTSSRPQDWVDGVPPKYAVQGLTYAHLDGLEHVYVPVRFMEPHEYDKPELCECDDDNTQLYALKVSDSDIAEQIDEAMEWYEAHVVGNVSPAFDEKRHKEYLKIMRRNEVKCDGLEALAKQAAVLEAKIEVLREKAGLDALEKELKALKDKQLKPAIVAMFKDTDDTVAAYGWRVKRSESSTIDKESMEADGVLGKYTVTTARYTLTKEKGN